MERRFELYELAQLREVSGVSAVDLELMQAFARRVLEKTDTVAQARALVFHSSREVCAEREIASKLLPLIR